jgi:hypothetical protein
VWPPLWLQPTTSPGVVNFQADSASQMPSSGAIMWASPDDNKLWMYLMKCDVFNTSSDRHLQPGQQHTMSIGACAVPAGHSDGSTPTDAAGSNVSVHLRLWSYDTHAKSWHAAPCDKQCQDESNDPVALAEPSARSDAMSFTDHSGRFLFLFGGFGLLSGRGRMERATVLSDLWVYDTGWVQPTGTGWTVIHDDEDASDPSRNKFDGAARSLWPVARVGRSIWTTVTRIAPSDGAGGSSGGDLAHQLLEHVWTFGGSAGHDIRRWTYDGPVNELWCYTYSSSALQHGHWQAIMGSSVDPVIAFMATLDDTSPGWDARWSSSSQLPQLFVNKSTAWVTLRARALGRCFSNCSAAAVDPCAKTWPVSLSGLTEFADSLCPGARFGAGSWVDTGGAMGRANGHAYVYGGISRFDPTVTARKSVTQLISSAISKHAAKVTSYLLDDLWEFNGNMKHPTWRRIQMAPYAPGLLPAWPQPAAMPGGWNGADGQIWLQLNDHPTIDMPCDAEEPDNCPAQCKRKPVWRSNNTCTCVQCMPGNLSVPTLWVFTPRTLLWEPVAMPQSELPLFDDRQQQWPGQRMSAVMAGSGNGNGWLMGGVGEEECQVPQVGHLDNHTSEMRQLSGLWMWA